MSDQKICILIPAYNAARSIHQVITDALKYCHDIIVADDGSTDDTYNLAISTGVKVVKIDRNKGKGNALKVLFSEAIELGYDAVITMDADGQHDADSIPSFIEKHKKYPDSLIVGSRMGDKSIIPQARLNSMRLANFFSSLAANQYLEDTQSGYRLYPLTLIKSIVLTSEKYATETEILIKAGDIGTVIRFVHIKTIYNDNGSHFRTIRDFSSITAYVIAYINIKWLKEGVIPDRPNTYKRGCLLDKIGRNKILMLLFQTMSVLATLPLAVFFLAEFLVLSPFMNNFASIRRYGCGYFKIVVATFMLPMLLVILAVDKTLNAFNIRLRLLDRSIEKYYPELRSVG